VCERRWGLLEEFSLILFVSCPDHALLYSVGNCSLMAILDAECIIPALLR